MYALPPNVYTFAGSGFRRNTETNKKQPKGRQPNGTNNQIDQHVRSRDPPPHTHEAANNAKKWANSPEQRSGLVFFDNCPNHVNDTPVVPLKLPDQSYALRILNPDRISCWVAC